jgi:uncharacterized membrane protein
VHRRRFLLSQRLRTSLWLIPFACALAGIALSLATVWIDRSLPDSTVPRSITGDPDAALTILSTVAASMVSLTALVLSITAVVVQLAMGQFSPRSVRPFLQDRPSQFAIGVFVGSFAHAMFAMREVRSGAETGTVPGVTIVTSYVLVFVSVVVLVAYVHHIGNSLKVDSIIKSVAEETRSLFDRLHPAGADRVTGPDVGPADVASDRAGFVFGIDRDDLVDVAAAADVTVRLRYGVGAFVPEGAPLLSIEGDAAPGVDHGALRRTIFIGPERTMDQDVAYGIQTLVDIAIRSLSDDYSDQTTAAEVIDRLHDLLRLMASRPLSSGRLRDDQGIIRVEIPEPTWDDYVRLAFDDLAVAGEGSPVVMRRLEVVLGDLVEVAPPERQPVLRERLDGWNFERGSAGEPRANDSAA